MEAQVGIAPSALEEISFWIRPDLDIDELYTWVQENCVPGYLVNVSNSWDGEVMRSYVLAMIPANKTLMFKLAWGGE